MNKRDFLKTGLLGAIGLIGMSTFAKTKSGYSKSVKTFKLPELPYAYDALEPYIDKETMVLHHTQHHAAYTNRLNTVIQEQGVAVENMREIFDSASKYNSDILVNSGGYFNHRIFFRMLSPNGGGTPTGKVAEVINSAFGSFENFKNEFSSTAKNQIGPGWTWLIKQNNTLKVINTSGQENPFMNTLPSEKRGFPLLCLDLWEHAYLTNYKNNKEEYIQAYWNIINWDFVNKRFNKSIS
jgi:superoxide dismutase, Fe-Mn family